MTAATFLITEGSSKPVLTTVKTDFNTKYSAKQHSKLLNTSEIAPFRAFFKDSTSFLEDSDDESFFKINSVPLTDGAERIQIISELTSDEELESLILNRRQNKQILKQMHGNCLSTKFPVNDEDKLPLNAVKLINSKNKKINNSLPMVLKHRPENDLIKTCTFMDFKNKLHLKSETILNGNSEAVLISNSVKTRPQKSKNLSNKKHIELKQNIHPNKLLNTSNKAIEKTPKNLQNNFESDTHRLSVYEHSIERRFSALSTSMSNDPDDAVNCDCTALATASWTRFQRRRKLKLIASKTSTTNSNTNTVPLGTGEELTVSDDSGLASSVSTTTTVSAHSLTLSASSTNSTVSLSKLPPKQPNRRPRSRSRALGILLGNMVCRMFDISSNSAKKSEWHPKIDNVEIIDNLPQIIIEDMNEITQNNLLNNVNNINMPNSSVVHPSQNSAYSPRWRGDDTNEASPLASSSMNATQKASNLHSNIIPGSTPREKTESPRMEIATASTSPALSPLKKSDYGHSSEIKVNGVVATTSSTSNNFNGVQQKQFNREDQKQAPLYSTFSSNNDYASRFKLTTPKPSIAGRLANMPRFYWPGGKAPNRAENDAIRERVHKHFESGENGKLQLKDFDEICRRMNFAVYTKRAVFDACCRLNNISYKNSSINGAAIYSENADDLTINFSQFLVYWNKMISQANDEAARFIFTLASTRSNSNQAIRQFSTPYYVTKEDFLPIFMDLIHTHPGLHFLKDTPQFHSKYCEVVITRIFWNVNRSWTGRITPEELRKSNFLEAFHSLEEESDINKITDYFSYEHFYVTYCKFWEIDTDHDMVICRDDMRQHCNGALTDRIIDRIFSGAVIRTPPDPGMRKGPGPVKQQPIETIGFEDFVAFLLAEEDKRHPTSIEYWFRCVDLDGDGLISLYEMEWFYTEIEQKLLAKNMETLGLRDVICNLLDSVTPANGNPYVTRSDLKRCGLAHRFFNTFVNYLKYLEQESSEGERASVKTSGDKEMSDWETFCAVEYELLMGDTDGMAGDGYADENIDVILDDDEEGEDVEELDFELMPHLQTQQSRQISPPLIHNHNAHIQSLK